MLTFAFLINVELTKKFYNHSKVFFAEEQIEDQRKRKEKEKERKVDWWELRKSPVTDFKV